MTETSGVPRGEQLDRQLLFTYGLGFKFAKEMVLGSGSDETAEAVLAGLEASTEYKGGRAHRSPHKHVLSGGPGLLRAAHRRPRKILRAKSQAAPHDFFAISDPLGPEEDCEMLDAALSCGEADALGESWDSIEPVSLRACQSDAASLNLTRSTQRLLEGLLADCP